MGLAKSIIGLFTGGFVRDVGEAIDRNVTSDEERMALRNELMEIKDKHLAREHEFNMALEENLTERHKADMQSDSWLAKNIRPITLAALTTFTLLYAAAGLVVDFPVDGVKYEAYKAVLTTLASLNTIVFTFYFGSRGIEKAVKSFVTNWSNK